MRDRLRQLRSGDDRGFGVVLGAMVMLGMVLLAFSTYQTSLAPDLQAREESQQTTEAADQLSRWTTSADQARPGSAAGAATVMIPLGSEAPPFSAKPSSSTLSFEPDQRPVRIDAGTLSISRLNGSAVGGTDETWKSTDNASVGSIVDVSRFRLRVAEIDSSHTGESVTVNVSNATGTHAGDLRLSVESPGDDGSGQGYELVVRTRDADGDVLYNQPILISSTTHDSHSDPISPYWVNLLNEDYQFAHVLDAAEPPYDVSLEPDGLDSDYTLAYVRQGSTETTGSTGLTVSDYNVTLPSGLLAFEARSQHAPNQALTVEHGAVVRSQGDGQIFAKEPSFSATLQDHRVHVALTWPRLTGPPDALAGSSVQLHGTPVETYQIDGQATNLTVNLTTDQPQLYQALFEDELEEVGLADGRGFSTATGTDWARVDVWGLTHPDPGADAEDVGVHLRSVETAVQIGG